MKTHPDQPSRDHGDQLCSPAPTANPKANGLTQVEGSLRDSRGHLEMGSQCLFFSLTHGNSGHVSHRASHTVTPGLDSDRRILLALIYLAYIYKKSII